MNEIYYTGFTEIEIIEKIIKAGLQAPTNDHMRDWHYIVIGDKIKQKSCLILSLRAFLMKIWNSL